MATDCKTVRPTVLTVVLSVLSCLSLRNVGVLWLDGWMDHNKTWHDGRPRPRPHCVRWGPSYPPPKRGHSANSPFSADVCYSQTAGWMKMPLGTEVGLDSGHIVLDGDSAAPSPERGTSPSTFRRMSIVAKRLDGSRWHLAWRWALVQATLC